MKNLLYKLDANITPTKTNETTRTFLPSELYLPEWARDTEFFRCMTILLDYLQNSLKDISNPKYAIIEQAYKDIGFKYKDIMQTSEESLKAMLIENGFGKILEIFKLSLEQIQMLTLYLPLLKIMKGTDVGYRLFLSLFANEYEIETWLDNPQELEEYTFNILFISWINVGLSSDMVTNFIEFSRSYVYPILKKVEMGITYKSLAPAVYCYPKLRFDITTLFEEEFEVDWAPAVQRDNLSSGTWVDVIYDGAKFVALDTNGYTSTSTDGIIWTSKQKMMLSNGARGTNVSPVPIINNWVSIAYSNSQYTCISFNGTIATSSDLENWTLVATSSLPEEFTALNYLTTTELSMKNFIAFNNTRDTFVSTDASSWSCLATDDSSTTWSYASIYANNKFIRLYETGDIEISNDAETWIERANSLPPKDATQSYTSTYGYSSTLSASLSSSTFKITISFSGRASENESLSLDFYDIDNHLIKTNTFINVSSSVMTTSIIPFGAMRVVATLNNSTRAIAEVSNFFYMYDNDKPTWKTIVYNNNNINTAHFIAISEEGYISTSLNGTTWTNPELITALSNKDWCASAYNSANYVVLVLTDNGYTSVKTE